MQLGERERERRVAAGAAEKGGREIEEVVLWLCVCVVGGGRMEAGRGAVLGTAATSEGQ